MTVSAAAMAGALAIALMGGETRPNRQNSASPQAAAAASTASFLVRFQGQGPIARAARAGDAPAERAIAAQLQRQNDLSGLCFGGFAGSAEIILRSCDAVAASELDSFQRGWLQRLRSMRAVAYAEIDTATPTRAPD